MKVYTIGRDASCHISLNDELISRRHALLKVYATGKMEIVDTSTNGTYINNVRMASNAPVPVTRKDIVSFARTRQLDWTLIPDPLRWVKWSLLGIVSIVVVCLLGTFIYNMFSDSSSIIPEGAQAVEMVNDTMKNKKTEVLDSISKTGSNDSLKNKKLWYEKEIQRSKTKKETKESEKNKENLNKKEEKKEEKKTEKKETKESKPEPKVKEADSQTNIVM